MVYLLSIGSTLLVLALRLVPTMLGKKERIWGVLWIAFVLFLVVIVQVVAGWFNLLKSQEVSVLANTAIAIMITGFVLMCQEFVLAVQKEDEKRKLLKVMRWATLALAILGVVCIVVYAFLRN